MSNALVPYIAQIIFSQSLQSSKRWLYELKRRLTHQPHKLVVYLSINDPYSYVLIQVLPEFLQRFNISIDFRTVLNKDKKMFPAPSLWQKNAFQDATWLAQVYTLNFPTNKVNYPSEYVQKVTAQLLHWELQPGYLEHALAIFHAYWQQDHLAMENCLNLSVVNHVECYDQHLAANENMLKHSGHYLSAMINYVGEWYWGLDRLMYLEQRLNHLNVNTNSPSKQKYTQHRATEFLLDANTIDAARRHQHANHDVVSPIELYWSIRSPYSYLALVRGIALAKHYQVPLIVKPVLPMVMRRMLVPKDKTRYISHDANREASTYKIPFGRIADPLGKGVENCYALFEWAKQQGKELEFLASFAKGVWSEGLRSDTDAGLKKIVERAGLDWQQAKPLLIHEDWRIWTQQNLSDLYGLDLWGVPSFHYKNSQQAIQVFGQDRLNVIEAVIVKNIKTINGEKHETV